MIHEAIFPGRRISLGVDIEKHLRGTMAQSVLDVFADEVVGRKPAGMIMPEFMKGDSKASRFDEADSFVKGFG